MKCAECGFYSDIHGCIHKDKPHWGLCGDMDACLQFEKRCEKRSGGSRGCGCDDKGKDKGDCGGGCGSGGSCQDTGKEERDRCRARLIAEDHLHDFSFGDYLYVGVL